MDETTQGRQLAYAHQPAIVSLSAAVALVLCGLVVALSAVLPWITSDPDGKPRTLSGLDLARGRSTYLVEDSSALGASVTVCDCPDYLLVGPLAPLLGGIVLVSIGGVFIGDHRKGVRRRRSGAAITALTVSVALSMLALHNALINDEYGQLASREFGAIVWLIAALLAMVLAVSVASRAFATVGRPAGLLGAVLAPLAPIGVLVVTVPATWSDREVATSSVGVTVAAIAVGLIACAALAAIRASRLGRIGKWAFATTAISLALSVAVIVFVLANSNA